MKIRIDQLLVKKGFFASRTLSRRAILDGRIFLGAKAIEKCSELIDENANIMITGENLKYVSRGGLKLEKAIETFKVNFKNKIVLDIGASTGGFTDCAISYGAKRVYAVDVGNNQLNEKLKNNEKVINLENCDIRNLRNEIFKEIDIIICDVSFISIVKVFAAIKQFLKKDTIILILIKPQFECGVQLAKKFKGVINDNVVRDKVLKNTLSEMFDLSFKCINITESPILGGDGNVEYLCQFTIL